MKAAILGLILLIAACLVPFSTGATLPIEILGEYQIDTGAPQYMIADGDDAAVWLFTAPMKLWRVRKHDLKLNRICLPALC